MEKVHLETPHERITRLTNMIAMAVNPEETKCRIVAFYCTECGIEFQNIEDMRAHELVKHKSQEETGTSTIKTTPDVKSNVLKQEEVFSSEGSIFPDTDFITMNTADLKLMLETIPEEVLNYDEDVFEKDFKTVLNSEKVEEEVNHMESYRCNECNFRATSKRCLKTHIDLSARGYKAILYLFLCGNECSTLVDLIHLVV